MTQEIDAQCKTDNIEVFKIEYIRTPLFINLFRDNHC